MQEIIGNQVEYYQDKHQYPDITEPNEAYWNIAKQGMYGVVNSPNGTARKAFAGTPYKSGRQIRDSTGVQFKRKRNL